MTALDQLCRLRSLRVQRARERCAQAQAEVDQAMHAVRERQHRIAHCRREIEALAHAVVHALAPRLPRWSGVAAAQRERLADRLERDEYALIGDEQALEEAQERLQQARAELTRALAREDALQDLAGETRRAEALAREQRSEREIEDQGSPRGRVA
ncbi:MAG TPA: hypothetical protein VF169_21910 [Albitalea sp.]|uniref:hypothetical protein n=1 Tax=Piscinibacter sp. TaxID=1903157 RepID=UPI002ED4A308